MTTGTNGCNGVRGLQQAFAYHSGKLLDRISCRTARPSKLRPLFRQVHTVPTRPFAPSSRPVISSAASAGNGVELKWQGPRKCLLYLPKHLQRASACVHTRASTSTPLTTESSHYLQNTPQEAQLSLIDGNEVVPDSSTSIGEVHGFQDDAEAEAMLWAYQLWLKREEIRGRKGESWTQKVKVSALTMERLYVHRESLDCAGKPQLLASVSAPTRVCFQGCLVIRKTLF